MSSSLTLGAEEELHLVDLSTWRLCARAPQVLAQLPNSNFKAELQRSTVETNTEVVETLADLRSDLLAKRRRVIDAASPLGVGIAAVGTAPRSDFGRDFELTTNGRFARSKEVSRVNLYPTPAPFDFPSGNPFLFNRGSVPLAPGT